MISTGTFYQTTQNSTLLCKISTKTTSFHENPETSLTLDGHIAL